MLRPAKMNRVVITGAKSELRVTVEVLHSLNIAHLIDYIASETGKTKEQSKEEIEDESNDEQNFFRPGIPMDEARDKSNLLLKLRTSAAALGIDSSGTKPSDVVTSAYKTERIDERILSVEQEIIAITQRQSHCIEQIKSVEDEISQTIPFIGFELPLEDFSGYSSLAVFTGRIGCPPKKVEQYLAVAQIDYSMHVSTADKTVIAVFAPKWQAAKVAEILNADGFIELKPPNNTGKARDILAGLLAKKQQLLAEQDDIKRQLHALRKKHAGFILASEEMLTIDVQKAEAPTHFATTPHLFIIDAWVPEKSVEHLRKELLSRTDNMVYFEVIEHEPSAEPPVELDNPKPVKPYQFLLDLYSTPKYDEIDPTFILSIIFPLFFGFMIGDCGYGILLMIVGLVFMNKFRDSETMYSIGWFIVVAGAFATLFGLLVFGDMFGLPFNAPAAHEGHGTGADYSWSSITGIEIPIHSSIHKMEADGVTQLLLLSIAAGFIHLGLGLLFGIINDFKHERRHAAGKFGLMLILSGIAILIFAMGDGTLYRWLLPLKQSPIGQHIWNAVIIPLKTGTTLTGIAVPYSTLVLILSGTLVLLASVGAFGFLEILEITGHFISYTRLAAICVAKGTMAFAFNAIGLGLIFSGNILLGIIGIVLIIILQMIVFILGSLSSGIQALRLHYIEFFMKFFHGGGTKFNPFGYKRRFTRIADEGSVS